MAKWNNLLKESMKKELLPENSLPACFGDEVKFVTYMESPDEKAECRRCPKENECGEYILLKCSRELAY